jgi:hypothetical protein
MDSQDPKDLQQIIDLLSAEQLEDLKKILSSGSKKPNKKRRGRGKRKKTQTPPSAKTVDKSSFLDGISLTPDEQKEMGEASQFDKERGLDRPKNDGIIPQSPSFQKVPIQCRICGKSFDISPSLIPPERNRFKCNKCSCSAG